MTAIRNVGELASPYYLLEVWARREEIDIDPETYASLKRKVRKLVRDARGFEMRAEDPDDEWRRLRADVLAVEPVSTRTVRLDDGSEFDLGVWAESSAAEALLVGDLATWDDPDRRSDDENDPPATRFELALDAYAGDADWGLLLAGLQVRVYRRSSGLSQQYLALDLDTLVELEDEPTWKAFAAIFRAPAFDSGSAGVPLIRRVVDESRRHAAELAADMRRDVVDAAEAIIQGALSHPDNRDVIGAPTRATLHQLFEESLYVLYRVLFVLYAEARDVLPVSGAGPYARSYSLEHLVELARHGGSKPDGRYYHETLRTLFDLLWTGPPDITGRLGFDPVGGELFDPERVPLLGACTVPDPAWERAITSVALGAPDSPRRKLGRRSSFAELGVDQLGSIYEGLLVLEPYLATETAYLGLHKGDRRVFPERDIEKFSVLRELGPGDFVLESAGGRRKGTGSFYTPHEITEYLTHAAIDPLVDQIFKQHDGDVEAIAGEILALKVCDPAMGSGAFLVQAARVLALALARARAMTGDGLVTPDRVQHAKREVVRHCLYGVDLNPLAVVLAKVSLWLETLEPGRPLSFLDAHLRCGDSIVGVSFLSDDGRFSAAELATFPVNAHKGLETYLKNEAGERGAPVLARLKARKKTASATQPQLPGFDRTSVEVALEDLASERERITSLEERAETLFDVQDAQTAFEELEAADDSIRNRLRRAADFWCAQWFSDGEDGPEDDHGPVVPATFACFDEVIATLVNGTPLPERHRKVVEAAEVVAERRRFFHWVLEFPEVLLDRGGFDAVIGNPPWNTLSPDSKEFFSTYDPKTFAKRKGAPPAVQASREAELRGEPEVDKAWRGEARFLHELSHYSRPESGRFLWFAEDGQLRKGDANVFRLFVERAYGLLRTGGQLSQVLPDSFYLSSPATGLRATLLSDGRVRFCWVFENRRKIFPIHSASKVVLLGVESGTGPTGSFGAKFFVGKDPAGRSRAVSVEELPDVLAQLDSSAPTLTSQQVKTLFPVTLGFPELQTALDAEIALKAASEQPALNLDEEGWGLTYCRELDADRDAYRFKSSEYLVERGAVRDGIRWKDPEGFEWWPLIEGSFYHLEFPAEGATFSNWVSERELRGLEARSNSDGTLTMEHYRMGWRDVTSPTNERGAIAAVLPPRTVAKDTTLTVWGGSVTSSDALLLAALFSSFTFDYLVRFSGKIHLKYGAVNSVPCPSRERLADALIPAAETACQSPELWGLWEALGLDGSPPQLDVWAVAERRALVDGIVAAGYGLSVEQFAAALATFPNLDRSQAMLAGEPKCFVTRDLALRAYCERTGSQNPDVAKLMREIGSGLPDPRPEFRDLDARIEAYKELGAVPYRPTPKGARIPTDPSMIEDVLAAISGEPSTVAELAQATGEDETVVAPIVRRLEKDGLIYREGRGKSTRYYRLDDD